MRGRALAACLLVLWLAGAGSARSEALVAALSSDRVRIESNFTGTEIVVFGEIVRDFATVARADPYDIAVIVTGPEQDVTTRRKQRFLGLWVNRDAETFIGVPGFYAAHVTRPVGDLAQRNTLERFQIGLHNISLRVLEDSPVPISERFDFRNAFLRLLIRNGLYSERAGSVEFLSDSLFRTTIPIPSNVPVGAYKVRTYLLRGGALLASQENDLTIAKTGFEQLTYTAAYKYSAIYGAVAVFLALFTGWLAGVIFRRD
ncbi:TIGR02186 family protein [Stappia sp. F7233]|uniref:TIGR02186 family protein n=1 Tax=Stappia albiluteola TaxID=2758565 RepID=A0A839AJ30_9HYPH|nr:TIGR02186 family protein [Stappia albiluteola]MBA5779155.1 TIGR02186 family protein [Stappia albiluteola]